MFSELVDRAVHSSGRPDALTDIAYWANETMRDISKRDNWSEDGYEEEVEIPAGQTSICWTPNVGRANFRRMEYVIDGCGCEPVFVRPNRRMLNEGRVRAYYYASQESFVFANVTARLRMYYWRYQPWLQYYPLGSRLVEYNPEPQGTQAVANTDEAINLVSNWMLERHNSVVLDGTLSAFYASKQDPRQQTTYARYERGLDNMIRSEGTSELLAR